MGRRDRRRHRGGGVVVVSAGVGRWPRPFVHFALERPRCVGHDIPGRRPAFILSAWRCCRPRSAAIWPGGCGRPGPGSQRRNLFRGTRTWPGRLGFGDRAGRDRVRAATTHIVAGLPRGLPGRRHGRRVRATHRHLGRSVPAPTEPRRRDRRCASAAAHGRPRSPGPRAEVAGCLRRAAQGCDVSTADRPIWRRSCRRAPGSARPKRKSASTTSSSRPSRPPMTPARRPPS